MEHSTPERHREQHGLSAVSAALNRVRAVIEFDLHGIVLHANDNFLKALGYRLDEVRSQHQKMFCEAAYVDSLAYRQFWEKLGRGEFDQGEYLRMGRGGREVWIDASYNPVFDSDGKPYKVIKFATDITAARKQNAEYEGKVRAIDRALARIEFDPSGNVLFANQNFLDTPG